MTTVFFAAPVEVFAGPASLASQENVGLSAPVDHVYYRRYYRHGYRYGYRPGYRGYRYGYYDPAGAAVAGAALGLVGAGVAAATAPRYYGYPGYGWGW